MVTNVITTHVTILTFNVEVRVIGLTNEQDDIIITPKSQDTELGQLTSQLREFFTTESGDDIISGVDKTITDNGGLTDKVDGEVKVRHNK
jgi:hypothetical protein